MKRQHCNSYKGQHWIGAGLQFRGLVHCHYGGKQGVTWQSWCWWYSWELYIQVSRKQEEIATGPGLGFWNPKAPSGRTYSKKVTPPNSATLCEPMGAIFIQSTTRANIIGNKGWNFDSHFQFFFFLWKDEDVDNWVPSRLHYFVALAKIIEK